LRFPVPLLDALPRMQSKATHADPASHLARSLPTGFDLELPATPCGRITRVPRLRYLAQKHAGLDQVGPGGRVMRRIASCLGPGVCLKRM